jgi:hypothetical protein
MDGKTVPVTHAAACLPRHGHGLDRPAPAAARARVASSCPFFQLLNIDGRISSI